MFGILTGRDVNAIFPEDWRGVNFAGAFRGWIFVRGIILLVLGRIAIVPPNFFEVGSVAFFYGLGVESVAEAFAAAEEDERFAVHDAGGGRTPLTVENFRADAGVILANQFAGF